MLTIPILECEKFMKSPKIIVRKTIVPLALAPVSILSLNVVLPAFIVEMGGSLSLMGILYSLQSVTRTLSRILGGLSSRVISFRKLLLVAMSLRALAYLLLYFSYNIQVILLSMIVLAIAQGLEGISFLALTAAMASHNEVATVFGIALTIRMGPNVIAPALTGYLADIYNVHAIFILGVGLSLISLIILMKGTSEKRKSSLPSSLMSGLITKEFLLLCIAFVFFFAALSSLQPILSVWIVRELKYGYKLLGLSLSVGAMIALASRVYTGLLSDRLGHLKILIGVGSVRIIAVFILILFKDPASIILSSAVHRLLMAAPPRNALISSLVSPELYGIAYGTIGIAMDIGRILGPLIVGFIAEYYGFLAAFLAIIAFLHVYLVVVFILQYILGKH